MNDTNTKLGIAPIARTADEYLAKRKLKNKRTLNDEVETVHLALAENEEYQAYREAFYDSAAVEGSLSIDDTLAAEMIREKSKDMEIVVVAKQNLATLVKTMRVVLRRFGESREELAIGCMAKSCPRLRPSQANNSKVGARDFQISRSLFLSMTTTTESLGTP